jgi:SAM-dependent methyltransferase
MQKLAKALIPPAIRRPVRRALDFGWDKATKSWTARSWMGDLHDAYDWLRGENDPMIPPRKLVWGIGGDLHVGERFLQYFQTLGNLQPHEAVLDIGCGIGRMALPLTRFLTPPGRYDGFDIVRANVGWCRRAIEPRFPHFHFQHANIFNREYNPRGTLSGDQYRFPYPDQTFDFAFLTSVFTHLLPNVVEHYLREIGRVLKPGGRCLTTVYLLNEVSNRLVDAGQSKFTLFPMKEHYRVHSEIVPETCVTLDETWFRQKASDSGLTLPTSPHYGLWCGREKFLDFQDIVVLKRVADEGHVKT